MPDVILKHFSLRFGDLLRVIFFNPHCEIFFWVFLVAIDAVFACEACGWAVAIKKSLGK